MRVCWAIRKTCSRACSRTASSGSSLSSRPACKYRSLGYCWDSTMWLTTDENNLGADCRVWWLRLSSKVARSLFCNWSNLNKRNFVHVVNDRRRICLLACGLGSFAIVRIRHIVSTILMNRSQSMSGFSCFVFALISLPLGFLMRYPIVSARHNGLTDISNQNLFIKKRFIPVPEVCCIPALAGSTILLYCCWIGFEKWLVAWKGGKRDEIEDSDEEVRNRRRCGCFACVYFRFYFVNRNLYGNTERGQGFPAGAASREAARCRTDASRTWHRTTPHFAFAFSFDSLSSTKFLLLKRPLACRRRLPPSSRQRSKCHFQRCWMLDW